MVFRQLCFKTKFIQNVKKKQKSNNLKPKESVSSLFKPVPVKQNSDNVGIELTGSLNKRKIVQILCDFSKKEILKELTLKYGLDGNFY